MSAKKAQVSELEARVRSQIRRNRGEVARERLEVADLVIDAAAHRVERDGQVLTLTPTAYQILLQLARSSPDVVTRQQLELRVWGDILPDSDTLRSHIYALRKIIDKPFETPLLHTLPGTGYRLLAE